MIYCDQQGFCIVNKIIKWFMRVMDSNAKNTIDQSTTGLHHSILSRIRWVLIHKNYRFFKKEIQLHPKTNIEKVNAPYSNHNQIQTT